MPDTYGIRVYDAEGVLGSESTDVIGRMLFSGDLAWHETQTVVGLDVTRPFYVGYWNPLFGFIYRFNYAKYTALTKSYDLYQDVDSVNAVFMIVMQW